MDDASRTEYPSMLDNLQPGQAVTVFNDRLKKINRINSEIADWLQERRRVEEQYVLSLRRLTQFKVPNTQSDLGVFHAPWEKILQSVEATAHSHHLLSTRIEKDVETPLRTFQNKGDMQNMNATAGNLASMARDLEDAQKKVEALQKKGGKGTAQKLDAASTKLTVAQQQWDSSAPFIFESLQAIDEQRINQLRDLLTQYQTHENDGAQRAQSNAVETLAAMLEVSTELEIASFKEKVIAGKPKLERRTSTRQSSNVGGSALAPPNSIPEDTMSEHSGPASESRQESFASEPKPQAKPEKTESKLRSKIGTMLGRRRQSIHGSGHLSPAKASSTFSRASSSHGRPGLSPRTSTSNLGEANNRLSSLAETPDTPTTPAWHEKKAQDGTNGAPDTSEPAISRTTSAVNGGNIDVSDVPPPPGPPPAQQQQQQPPQLDRKDSEGFTVPPPANDPISQAQRDAAAEEPEQTFKLNIADTPIAEEDPEDTKAAMSNVASTLGKMSAPSRKMGTVRGRRDVRNTIYVPSPVTGPSSGQTLTNENPFPSSPTPAAQTPDRPTAAPLTSQVSLAATSDTQSIRSANSLNNFAHLKHPEMRGPGLNSSIVETVSATFEAGVIKSAKISGEIAFSYHAEEGGSDRETIRINNFANLEAIGPNRIFVHNVAEDRPDEFTLDLTHLNKTSTGFTYRVHAADDTSALAEHVPLLLNPVWKPQGDKLGLLLQYSLNPSCKLPGPVTLHNVVFVATYEGARASGAQTKPSGTHLKDKHLVYWRLGDLTLTSETQKIICRIIGAENAEPKPGLVEARWEYTPAEGTALGSGISVSKQEESKGKEKESSVEDDPFADEGAAAEPAGQRWAEVPLVRKIVSGKYEAKSSVA